jgi:hypothetical protein
MCRSVSSSSASSPPIPFSAMRLVPRGAFIIALVTSLTPVTRIAAQQVDVIRGRVTAEDGRGVENARIEATAIPNNVTRSALTDRSGRFTIIFAGGTGDYWIRVSAVGFARQRFELKRLADEEILIGDVRLTRAAVVLDEVRVQADRRRVGRNENADVSGTEKSVGVGAVSPDQAGNLAAMAAALPGVQLIPGADGNPDQFSVFGLSGDQNNFTLNGFGFGGTDVPRDAATRAALTTSPWDVSRGGFSGAQFGMRTLPGSNFSARGMSSLVNTPLFQWTDAAGRSTGSEYSSLSLGGAASGPIVQDRSFYNAGYQIDRRSSDLLSLTSANALGLQTAGVAGDSVTRLREILSGTGVPLSTSGLPASRVSDRLSALATFDMSPPAATNGQALNVTFVGAYNRSSSPFGRLTALPTADAASTNWFAALQARSSTYFGFGILSETSVGFNTARVTTDPYLTMPSGTVRVSSVLDDGSSAISTLAFGGSPRQNTGIGLTAIAAQNQLSWFSLDNKHRVKLSGELRLQSFDQDFTTNALGTFVYNSLADLEAETPAAFMRTLSPRVRSGRQLLAGLSLGDAYRPMPDLQIQFGLRLDGNRFLSSPAQNPELAELFGADNARVPNRLYLSPRAGFSWTYGVAPQLAIGSGFVRGPRAVVRGGTGIFQNVPNVQTIASALSNTGLPDAVRQLACVGAAVPRPAWSTYLGSPAAIPEECADGTMGSPFARSTSEVSLFDPGYDAQRSWRSNVNWSGAAFGDRLAAAVDVTYSRNLNQPGVFDLNFNPATRFALTSEGERPVYVDATAIVPATGAIAAPGARLSSSLGYVMQQRSDLESENRQLTVALQPMMFSSTFGWTFAYVYSRTRDVARGFGGSTAGDPRISEWARSPLDSRHQFAYTIAYNVLDWLPMSLTGSFRSGRPFTPIVSGDINGDGFANDRAFVFDPAMASVDASTAMAMRSLLSDGSGAARDCLSRQIGSIAGRNSCQGPWTSTSNLTIAVNPVKFRLPQRLNFSLYVNNVLGAADLLLNGERNRRGWGQSIAPDPTLLYVRGFDASAGRFRYEVNPRFGSTDLRQTLSRNPVVVTAQFRLDIGLPRERQLLTQSLDRGRGQPGEKATNQDVRSLSSALVPANPMALILQQADSLNLSRKQADSLATLNRIYTVAFDSLWAPVATFLAGLPETYDRGDAYDRYRRAREASVDVLIRLAPEIRGLLTPAQRRMLPPFISSSLDMRYLAAVRSSTIGGANMGVLAMLAQMGVMSAAAGGSGSGQTIMMHR